MSNCTANSDADNCLQHKDSALTMTLYFIEILLYIFGIICCFFFIILLIKAPVFHQNLRLLLIHLALGCIFLGLSRDFFVVQFIAIYMWGYGATSISNSICWTLNSGYYCALYIVALSPIMLVVERTVATVKVKIYETSRSLQLAILLILVQWGFCATAITLSEMENQAQNYNYTLCYEQGSIANDVLIDSLCIVIICDIVAIVAFVALLSFNKRRYSETFVNREHSLSERYQLSENIKTTRFMVPVVSTNFICQIIGIVLTMVSTLLDQNSYERVIICEICNHMFVILVASFVACLPWLSSFGHPELQKQAKKALAVVCHGATVAPTSEPRNANGDALILDPANERDSHFAALQSMWN